jgi:dihydrofolate reductase
MREVVASLFLSLDGVAASPQTWHFPYANDEMGVVVGKGMASADAFLLGRRTFEEWRAYWPSQENPMAEVINSLPKYVASRSLRDPGWANSVVLGPDVAGEVRKLKEQAGKEIAVVGSATLVRSLLHDRLVDELRLLVHPLLVGGGGRLFDDETTGLPLELVESETFANGVLNLVYRPAA